MEDILTHISGVVHDLALIFFVQDDVQQGQLRKMEHDQALMSDQIKQVTKDTERAHLEVASRDRAIAKV